MTWTIIGVDPAPTKPATLWTAEGPATVANVDLRKTLQKKSASDSVLVTWDAPLSFDAECGYSDRPIDRAIRRFLKDHAAIARKAVAVRPFSGCSHWAVTCATLGRPFRGSEKGDWHLAGPVAPTAPGHYVAEVHPAVALAFWWAECGLQSEMPKYKAKSATEAKAGLQALVSALDRQLAIPSEASGSDDLLDAWVAYRLGCDFISGKATVVGVPAEGAYLLPLSAKTHSELDTYLGAARRELRRKASRGR